jgi:hypothetical protein
MARSSLSVRVVLQAATPGEQELPTATLVNIVTKDHFLYLLQQRRAEFILLKNRMKGDIMVDSFFYIYIYIWIN